MRYRHRVRLLLISLLLVMRWYGHASAGMPIASDLVVFGTINAATDTGSANAYAITLIPPITAYVTGQVFAFKAANANTTSSTLAVNGLSTLTLKTPLGGSLANLSSGDILVGQRVECYVDGTTCVVTSQLNGQDTRHTTATPQFGSLTLNLNSAAVSSTGISPLNAVIAGADSTLTTQALLAFAQSPRMILLRADGTAASPTAVQSAEILGNYAFGGYDGSGWTSSLFPAFIRATASQNWSGSAHGVDLLFCVAANGSTSASCRARLFNSGAMTVGNSTTDPGTVGVIDAGTGFRVNNAATKWTVLQSDGSNFVPAAPCITTRPGFAPKTNTTSGTDDDFASIYTIPAGDLKAQSWLQVTLDYTYTTGGGAVSQLHHLKLGGTKVYSMGAAVTPSNSTTRSYAATYNIIGTAAASASANVDVDIQAPTAQVSNHNTIGTLAHNTSGTLTIVPGLQWGATGGADSLTLRNVTVCWKS